MKLLSIISIKKVYLFSYSIFYVVVWVFGSNRNLKTQHLDVFVLLCGCSQYIQIIFPSFSLLFCTSKVCSRKSYISRVSWWAVVNIVTNLSRYIKALIKIAYVVVLVTGIWELPGLNVGWETSRTNWNWCGIPGIEYQIRPWIHPSTSFTVHYSPAVLSLDTV